MEIIIHIHLIDKTEQLLKRMKWKALFYDNEFYQWQNKELITKYQELLPYEIKKIPISNRKYEKFRK